MHNQRPILLFGDQTVNVVPSVKELYQTAKKSRLLTSFIRQCDDILVMEISRLSACHRSRTQHLRSMLQLAEYQRLTGRFDTRITTVLSCFIQTAFLIRYIELEGQDRASDSLVVGSCTGLLAAALAATVTSVYEIMTVGPEIVRLAFRLGDQVQQRSEQIEDEGSSWAMLVSGIAHTEVEELIREFRKNYPIPMLQQPYISAVADDKTLTISGPPRTLQLLWASSNTWQKASSVRLPISAAFHAAHMSNIDFDSLIQDQELFRGVATNGAACISPSSGNLYEAQDLLNLLHLIVVDIVQEPLHWQKLSVTVLRLATAAKSELLISMGPNNLERKLTRDLKIGGINISSRNVIQDAEVLDPPNDDNSVAMVGLAGRFPGAETLEEYWRILVEGLDQHKKVPADRFDLDTHFDPSGKLKNSTLSPYGCFIERPGAFDAKCFSMSPREAAQTDPGQRLMLLTTYEALEMAGYTPNGTPSTQSARIGTFFGQTIDDYREHNASQEVDMYYATGGIRAFGPGRLNYYFKWEGPSYSVDTACSSSSVAIQLAYQSLIARECDMAVAGGANVLTGSDMFAGLSRGGFLSKTGSCKTFDKDADGYCRADGVATIVLKRLVDAVADRDNIQAVIKMAKTNHSANAISITHPHAQTQITLFEDVLMEAGIGAHEIDYVEMHGTGTQAGDGIEYASVAAVFGDDDSRAQPLYIGTQKPNFGHAEASAGVSSILKAALMLRHSKIPPHVGIKNQLNPKLQTLGHNKIEVALQPKAFPKHEGKRTLLVNNFSAAGGNTSILLEDSITTVRESEDPRSCHVVTISGKTATSLQENSKRLLHWLSENSSVGLGDVAYTTTARRVHHGVRKSYAVESIEQLVTLLSQEMLRPIALPTSLSSKDVGFVFSGQGSSWKGMAEVLLMTCPTFRERMCELDKLCTSQSLPSIMPVLNGTMTEFSPVQSQLAVVCLDLSIANLWQSYGLQPRVVMGHSLGEYAALCFAGVISASNMIHLVGSRALLMQERCMSGTHSMLAIRATLEEVDVELSKLDLDLEIACLNGPSSIVVTGVVEHIMQLKKHLDQNLLKSTVLAVPYAFHSQQMEPILTELENLAHHIEFKKPTIPVASTLLGKVVIESGVFCSSYVARQTRGRVDIPRAMAAYSESIGELKKTNTIWVECGPGSACAGMITSTGNASLTTLLKTENSWKTIARTLATLQDAGAKITWRDVHKDFETSLLLLEMPSYAFDLKNYWIQYEGDWSITKNVSTNVIQPSKTFITECLHHVVSEVNDKSGGTIVFTSNLAEPTLAAMAKGHMVHGIALVPSSVYAEMVYGAVTYIHAKRKTDLKPDFDLSDMEIFRPLIAKSNGLPQHVYITAKTSLCSEAIQLIVTSEHDVKKVEHARCTVNLGNANFWSDEWAQTSYLVADRMNQLQELATAGDVHVIKRQMVYKLFEAVVSYDEKYHSLDKVLLNSERHEASATVIFRAASSATAFCSPYWIDTLAQLGGFALNGSPSNMADTVFLSTGWGSIRIIGKLERNKSYRSYVHMRNTSTQGLLSGEVYLFDGDNVVGMCQGLKFRQMKLSLLKSVLGVGSMPARSVNVPVLSETRRSSHAQIMAPEYGSQRSSWRNSSHDVIMEGIAQEIGVGVSELNDDASFSDLGVGSLLTVSLMESLRTVTGMDLPSSLLVSCPTIADLKLYFVREYDMSDSSSSDIAENSDDSDHSSTRSRATSISSNGEELDGFLKTVALELGVETSELEPSTLFSDLGLDSLMSISILEALRNTTGLELASSFFNDNTCMAEVNRTLSIVHTSRLGSIKQLQKQNPARRQAFAPGPSGANDETVLTIIASELGLNTFDIEPSTQFADLGLDSLMSISIIDALREQTGRDLASSFFLDNTCLTQVNKALGIEKSRPHARLQLTTRPMSNPSIIPPAPDAPLRSTSIHLQGPRNSDTPFLFLLPDGSGSALSYINLPMLNTRPALPVYALNSPFVPSKKNDTIAFTLPFKDIASLYLVEIQRLQKKGPYLIAGWSMGGIYAYEVSRQLLAKGEAVDLLCMIDSPCPGFLPPLPKLTLDILEKAGLFDSLKSKGTGCIQEGTRRHFLECVRVLEDYDPIKTGLGSGKVPRKIAAIWAEDGVLEGANDEQKQKAMGEASEVGVDKARDWLMNKRTEFGPNGWDKLFDKPGIAVECHVVKGNHFSVMDRVEIKAIGEILGGVISKL